MAFDAKLTPLHGSGIVDSAREDELKSVGIVSIEELVSAARTSRADVRRLLSCSDSDIDDLMDRADELLSDENRALLSSPVEKYALGANPPGRDGASGKYGRGDHSSRPTAGPDTDTGV